MDLSKMSERFTFKFTGNANSIICNNNLLRIIGLRLSAQFGGGECTLGWSKFKKDQLHIRIIGSYHSPSSEYFLSLINQSRTILMEIFTENIYYEIMQHRGKQYFYTEWTIFSLVSKKAIKLSELDGQINLWKYSLSRYNPNNFTEDYFLPLR